MFFRERVVSRNLCAYSPVCLPIVYRIFECVSGMSQAVAGSFQANPGSDAYTSTVQIAVPKLLPQIIQCALAVGRQGL